MEHGPLKTSMQSAMAETEEVIYSVVEGLLQKTHIHPREVIGSDSKYILSTFPVKLCNACRMSSMCSH